MFIQTLALQASESPVDLLVCGFTVCGATMLLSEYYGVPMVPFVLQPSSIPSKEAGWRAIEPIASTTCCERPFTSHAALQGLKTFTELGLPLIRRKYGWRTAATWRVPAPSNLPVCPSPPPSVLRTSPRLPFSSPPPPQRLPGATIGPC